MCQWSLLWGCVFSRLMNRRDTMSSSELPEPGGLFNSNKNKAMHVHIHGNVRKVGDGEKGSSPGWCSGDFMVRR